MTKREDGGPAFPVHGGYEGDDPRNGILGGGMTLRDWFAGQALAGLLAYPEAHINAGTADKAAISAFQLADAMLAERQKASQ